MITTIQTFVLSGALNNEGRRVSIAVDRTNDSTKWSFAHPITPVRAREATVRLRSALPDVQGRGVDVALSAGCDLRPAHDLAIACALLSVPVDGLLVAGEAGLDGSVRAVPGITQAVLVASATGMRGVLVPRACAREAAEVARAAGSDVKVYVVGHLRQLTGTNALTEHVDSTEPRAGTRRDAPDFADVRGQSATVEALAETVARSANVALVGPPGVGKTMLARRVPGLLPDTTDDEALEITLQYSALGLARGLVEERPFRAPHHTISAAALAGSTRPGELQLAARGVLFLDELPEFTRAAIESLAGTLDRMPVASRPLVIAASNPCPCGWYGSTACECTCTEKARERYAERVEWALGKLNVRERVAVGSVSLDAMRSSEPGESTASLRARTSRLCTDCNTNNKPKCQ